MHQDNIVVRGAREHNLRDLNLEIFKNALCVIAGPSGSGKTSLAIDVIAAESEYRSALADRLSKDRYDIKLLRPKVDEISNLPPILTNRREDKANRYDSIASFLNLDNHIYTLSKEAAERICPRCSGEIKSMAIEEVTALISAEFRQELVAITADLEIDDDAANRQRQLKYLTELESKGLYRLIAGGHEISLNSISEESINGPLSVGVIVDRLNVQNDPERLRDAVEQAFAIQTNGISLFQMPLAADSLLHRYPATPCCISCGYLSFSLLRRYFDFRINPNGLSNSRKLPVFRGIASISEEQQLEFFSIKIKGITIHQLLNDQLSQLALQFNEKMVANLPIFHYIAELIARLCKIGLGHLQLKRSIHSLSHGEWNRLRLAKKVGYRLTCSGIVIDEPSSGLHHQELPGLIALLKDLRDLGNTVIAVDHNQLLQRSADQLIIMGPGSGKSGGTIISQVSSIPEESTNSLGSRESSLHQSDCTNIKNISGSLICCANNLKLSGASNNNLKAINLEIPLERLVAVAGISGSGKSSLIAKSLAPAITLALKQNGSLTISQLNDLRLSSFSIEGNIKKCVIGQALGGNVASWSTVASYCTLYPALREFYCKLRLSQIRGYTSKTFSLSAQNKFLCSTCKGLGVIVITSNQTGTTLCPDCSGKRFKTECLAVKYRGFSIADLLDMTAIEALDLLQSIPDCCKILKRLCDFGLPYLVLGQQTNTLSHGELQRLTLVKSINDTQQKNIYIFDEPTSGLDHIQVKDLIEIFKHLVKLGNTIIAVEHNLRLIQESDYLIELGPGAGEQGGNLIYCGSPREILKAPKTPTVTALKTELFNIT